MSDYTKIVDYAPKDALSTGNAAKKIKGVELGAEFDAIAVAVATKANTASPTFTGTVTIPTPFTLGAVSVTPTGTELNFVDGVTSNIQTQLDAKLALAGGTVTGDITMSGASIIEAEGAAVASATTCDIWATDGNTRHITGTTTITSFGTAPQAGAWMKVIFDGVLTLTHGANLSLPGSANITTAADDFAMVYADTTTQFDVLYFRKDGTAVVAPASGVTTFNTRSGAVTLTFADISASMGRFASSDQSITASGSLTLAHGLSSAPNLIQMFIKCTTAELGFSVNDVLPVGLGIGSYSTTITSDASNLYVKYPDVGLAVSRKDTGGSTAITVGNWVAIFRAWYL